MYTIEKRKKNPYSLDIPSFGIRNMELLLCDKRKKIVYIKNEFDNSTFRYRYYNFKEALANSDKYLLTCFLCSEIPCILNSVDNIDLIVLQRTTWDINTNNLIFLCKQKGIKIVYDIDDLIYKYDYIPDYMNVVGLKFSVENVRTYMGIAAAYEFCAKSSDLFICTTDYLNKKIIEDFEKPSYIIQNFYNNSQYSISKSILENRTYDEDKFVIGYFSGSPSHLNDFRVCEKDIIKLMKKYDNVYLKIVGFMDLDDELISFKNEGRVIFKPLCSYLDLQYEIGTVDINVAPLFNYFFNYAKSELKFFEAALVKIPSIVSNVGVYSQVIKNSFNGILANDDQWFEKLEELYLNSNLRNKIADNSYKYVVDNYSPSVMMVKIEETFDKILMQ